MDEKSKDKVTYGLEEPRDTKLDRIVEQNIILRELIDGSFELAVKKSGLLRARYAEVRETVRGENRCKRCNRSLQPGSIAVETEGKDIFGIKLATYICVDCVSDLLEVLVKDNGTLKEIKAELDILNARIEIKEQEEKEVELRKAAAANLRRKMANDKRKKNRIRGKYN